MKAFNPIPVVVHLTQMQMRALRHFFEVSKGPWPFVEMTDLKPAYEVITRELYAALRKQTDLPQSNKGA